MTLNVLFKFGTRDHLFRSDRQMPRQKACSVYPQVGLACPSPMKWGSCWPECLLATTIIAVNTFRWFHVTDASSPLKGVSGWTAQRKLAARCVLDHLRSRTFSYFCLVRRHGNYGIMGSIAT